VIGVDALEVDIQVTDTGIGIPPDAQAAVLEPFEQVQRAYTCTHGGSGGTGGALTSAGASGRCRAAPRRR
jgi:signal transduction histidine kinase